MRDVAISFLTAAFNAEKTLGATVGTLLAQTRGDWEVVIVDDGSTDSTLLEARRLAAVDPRIIVLSKANGGTASARNLAATVAAGRWWCVLDADDEIAPEFVEGMLRFADEHAGFDIYSCWVEMRHPDGTTEPFDASDEAKQLTSFTLDDMLVHNRISATALFDPGLFQALGGFRDVYNEDYDFWIRALLLGARHLHNPDVSFIYHVSESGKSSALLKAHKSIALILRNVALSPGLRPHTVRTAKRMAGYYETAGERMALEERLRTADYAGARSAYWQARAAYLNRWKWAVGLAIMLLSPALFAHLFLHRH